MKKGVKKVVGRPHTSTEVRLVHSPVPLWRIRIARWVSIIAHPFVTALLLVGGVEAHRGPVAAARSVVVVGLLFVLPLAVLTARQVHRGAWATVDASHPRERPMLFLVGGAGLAAVLAFFTQASAGAPLVRGAVCVLGMLAFCALVTPWIKVSLHMAAAALTAIVLLSLGTMVGWLLAATLPVLGWSRVALGRHRWLEIVLGLAVGAGTGAFIVR